MFQYPTVCLPYSVSLSFNVSVGPSVRLSVRLSVCLSVCLSVYLSVSLSLSDWWRVIHYHWCLYSLFSSHQPTKESFPRYPDQLRDIPWEYRGLPRPSLSHCTLEVYLELDRPLSTVPVPVGSRLDRLVRQCPAPLRWYWQGSSWSTAAHTHRPLEYQI